MMLTASLPGQKIFHTFLSLVQYSFLNSGAVFPNRLENSIPVIPNALILSSVEGTSFSKYLRKVYETIPVFFQEKHISVLCVNITEFQRGNESENEGI